MKFTGIHLLRILSSSAMIEYHVHVWCFCSFASLLQPSLLRVAAYPLTVHPFHVDAEDTGSTVTRLWYTL